MSVKEKNVIITAKAYKMLIDDYHLQPSQLLAKLPKSNIKINSPKTGRFIQVGSATYMKLLQEYTEEELMLRQDGYIISPETNKLIKVFSKTFNNLLDLHPLQTLLSLPRQFKDGKQLPIVKEQLPIKILLKDFDINDIIKLNHQMAIFSYAQHVNYFYCSAHFMNDGHLIGFTEAVEHHGIEQEIVYTFNKLTLDDVTSCDTLKEEMQLNNDNKLNDINIKSIDLMSLKLFMIKSGHHEHDINKKIIKLINKKYKSLDQKLFNVIDHHLWYNTHIRLLNKKVMFNKLSFSENLIKKDDDQYEEFDEIKNLKLMLINDINIYHDVLLKHFNKL